MDWPNEYIGIPYIDHGRTRLGCDCWGLVRLIYRERLAIELPSLATDYVSAEEAAEVSALVHKEQTSWKSVNAPAPFDVIVLRLAGLERHVGVVIKPGIMLHVMRGIDAAIENYTNPLWHRRAAGFYRHHHLTA